MAAVESEQDTRDEFNDSNNSGENVSVNSEGEADDIIERLQDVTTLTVPDRDIPSSIGDSDSTRSTEPGETESVGAASQSDSGSVSQPESREGDSEHITNGHETVSNASTENTDDGQSDNNQNKTGGKDSTKKKGLNPVKGLLRKFTRSSSKSGESVAKGATKNKSETAEDLSSVTVDKLPQCFIVKYLGRRQCDGLWGIKHVRKPVDEMVKRVTRQLETGDKPVELPLMYLIVSSKGLELRAHPNNRVNDPNLPEKGGGFPIDFISYGVQDLKFWRVFTFIVVQELSARSKKMDCHAFICDSSVAARKVALSLALGFKVNMNKLKKEGKEHRFQVDLRPPGELADKYSSAEDGAEAEVADC